VLNDPSYYRGFSAEQYAADKFFQAWVLSPDPAIDSYWQTYLNLNPAEGEQVQAARQIVLEFGIGQESGTSLSAAEKAAIRTNIFEQLGLEETEDQPRIGRRRPVLFAAASMLAVVAVSAFLLLKSPAPQETAMLVESTSADETRELVLPDSSVVILNANSSLSYSSDFNSPLHREVFLKGNAFFKVRKLADHKNFVVHSRSLAVTVLGTEFNVNSRNASIEVALISGKVKVDEAAHNQSALILPGEQITFDSSSSRLLKSQLDVNLYSAWTDNTWNFRQTSMEKVIELLEKYYGVKAEFKNLSVKDKKITASIPVRNLDMLTMVLSRTVHAEIKHLNDRLIIQ
jgi:transmembrane sensor